MNCKHCTAWKVYSAGNSFDSPQVKRTEQGNSQEGRRKRLGMRGETVGEGGEQKHTENKVGKGCKKDKEKQKGKKQLNAKKKKIREVAEEPIV